MNEILNDSFVLKKMDYFIKEINEKKYFQRYDLHNEFNQLNDFINKYKNKKKRLPFTFELLDTFLNKLDDSKLIREIKSLLYSKDCNWFIKVGQYFFYNLFNWMQQYKKDDRNFVNKFIREWWDFFIKYEKNGKNLINDKIRTPNKILLELTNNCNLNCIMCGIGKYGYDPSRNMSIDLLKSLCSTILSKTSLIRLNGLGESTILPSFIDYLNLLSNLPAKLEIVTNLMVKKREIWNKLIENNVTFLISCDSSNPKIFESIRRGANFNIFKKNLEFIGKSISNPLNAHIIFTLMEYNINELNGVVELAANHGIGGVIVNVVKISADKMSWIRMNEKEILKNFYEAFELAQSLNIKLKIPDHVGHLIIDDKIAKKTCKAFCQNPWNEVYVRYNGDLTVCNMLNPYIYGNCKLMPFEEIWNGLNANLFRNFVNTEFKHQYCRDCYYVI
ncbi:MAG: radical SAM/SPASM domain-containing protein [Promethearchaeota archaeon]